MSKKKSKRRKPRKKQAKDTTTAVLAAMHKSKALNLDLKRLRSAGPKIGLKEKQQVPTEGRGAEKNLKAEGGAKARSGLQNLKLKIVGSTTEETEAGNNVGSMVY